MIGGARDVVVNNRRSPILATGKAIARLGAVAEEVVIAEVMIV